MVNKKGEVNRQFESEYRSLIASEMDNLQLSGIEHFDGAKQPLSVAIRLHVEMKSRRDDGEQYPRVRRRHRYPPRRRRQ